MSYFAQIDNDNVVVNVIVAEQSFIDSGAVGDPSKWLACAIDGSIRGRYPGVGYRYISSIDEFVPPKPDTNPSFVWNNLPGPQGRWVPPIPFPGNVVNGIEADWNEELVRWDIKQRPKPYPPNPDRKGYYWSDELQDWVEGPPPPHA